MKARKNLDGEKISPTNSQRRWIFSFLVRMGWKQAENMFISRYLQLPKNTYWNLYAYEDSRRVDKITLEYKITSILNTWRRRAVCQFSAKTTRISAEISLNLNLVSSSKTATVDILRDFFQFIRSKLLHSLVWFGDGTYWNVN